MALSGFALLWLLLAVGCLFLGTLFTAQRREETTKIEHTSVRACCWYCGEVMERDERFCGSCGKFRAGKEHRSSTIHIQAGRASRK